MKTAIKQGMLALGLACLVSCGGEEEIVYEPSPIVLPTEYVITADDTAPAFYTDVMTLVTENILPPETEGEELDTSSLTKEEIKLLEEEAKRVEAAWEAELEEIVRSNNKLMSIRLVSTYDPTEANTALIDEAQAIRDEEIAAQVQAAADAAAQAAVSAAKGEGGDEDDVTETTLTAEELEAELPSLLYSVPQEAYVYTYDTSTTGKTGGVATADYVAVLQGEKFKIVDAFHPVNEEYYEMITPDYTQRAGTVALARNLSVAGRIFLIIIDWNANGAVVTVSSEPGTIWVAPKKSTTAKSSLTIEDAVTYLGSRNPSDLGLDGTSMADYNIYTAEGLVMINGTTYRQFNISGKATDGGGVTFGGSYLIESEGNVFKIDNVTGTIVPLNITNVYDTMK